MHKAPQLDPMWINRLQAICKPEEAALRPCQTLAPDYQPLRERTLVHGLTKAEKSSLRKRKGSGQGSPSPSVSPFSDARI